MTAEQVSAAAALRADIRRQLERLWQKSRVIVVPTVPGAALLRHASLDMLEAYRRHAMRLLCVAGLGGCPQVTLPFLRAITAKIATYDLKSAGLRSAQTATSRSVRSQHRH